MAKLSRTGTVVVLFDRQKGRCFYCGCDLVSEVLKGRNLHIDHRLSQLKGGSDILENKALTCPYCNTHKHDMNDTEFRDWLKPFMAGILKRNQLSDFHKYKKLHKRFKDVENDSQMNADVVDLDVGDLRQRMKALEIAHYDLRTLVETMLKNDTYVRFLE